MINDDVASLARRLRADHALNGNNLSDERVLLLRDVDLHVGLVPVRSRLKERQVLARCREGRARGSFGGHAVIRDLGQRSSHPQTHFCGPSSPSES